MMETCSSCSLSYEPLQALQGLCPRCLLGIAQRGSENETASIKVDHAKCKFRPPSVEALQPHFQNLEIVELSGSGGMSAVYRAKQVSVDRMVAVKILPEEIAATTGGVARFMREAQVLAKLNHPNIVTLYDAGTAGPWCYLVMEYVDGVNLRQLAGDESLSLADVFKLMPEMCAGLQYAHDQQVVHRDIKPENVMIDRQGRVKITDFGLARLFAGEGRSSSLTEVRQAVGTPQYAAPEQIERPESVDHRADLYSLGVVMYELITGEIPRGNFELPSQKTLAPATLDGIVLRALASEPQRRYQQASDLRHDLDVVALGTGTERSAFDHSKRAAGSEWILAAAVIGFAVGGVNAAFQTARLFRSGLVNLAAPHAHPLKDEAWMIDFQGAFFWFAAVVGCAVLAVIISRMTFSAASLETPRSLAHAFVLPILLAGYLLLSVTLAAAPAAAIAAVGGLPLAAEAQNAAAPRASWPQVLGFAGVASAIWTWCLSFALARWRHVAQQLFYPLHEASVTTLALAFAFGAALVFFIPAVALLVLAARS